MITSTKGLRNTAEEVVKSQSVILCPVILQGARPIKSNQHGYPNLSLSRTTPMNTQSGWEKLHEVSTLYKKLKTTEES